MPGTPGNDGIGWRLGKTSFPFIYSAGCVGESHQLTLGVPESVIRHAAPRLIGPLCAVLHLIRKVFHIYGIAGGVSLIQKVIVIHVCRAMQLLAAFYIK